MEHLRFPEEGVGFLVIVLLRLTTAPAILKYPLLGGLLALGLDHYDLDLIFLLGGVANYQNIDKALDLYYLSFEAYVVCFWENLFIRNLVLFLFFYRLLGIILFQGTQNHYFLFIFPNFFEVFFLWYLIYQKISGINFLTQRRQTIIFTFTLTFWLLIKLYQEYYLHLSSQNPWPGSEFINQLF